MGWVETQPYLTLERKLQQKQGHPLVFGESWEHKNKNKPTKAIGWVKLS